MSMILLIASYERTVKTFLIPLVLKDELSSGSSGSVTLRQRGPPLRVEVSPKKEPMKGVTSSSLIDWMKNKSLCLSQMKHLMQFIRKRFGRCSVEKHARDKLVEYSHQLDKFFDLVELNFLDKDGQTLTRKVPVVNDVEELLRTMHDKMELDIHDTFLKIGIDAGHGSLKVIISRLLVITSYNLSYLSGVPSCDQKAKPYIW